MNNRLISIGIVSLLVIAGFIGTLNLVSENASAYAWSIETVDSAGSVSEDTSIALGQGG